MREKPTGNDPLSSATAAQLIKNRQAIAQLAQSHEVQSMMRLLRQSGDVQQAAQAAAKGEPAALMSMVQQLLSTQQGAKLADQIGEQAKQAGIKEDL